MRLISNFHDIEKGKLLSSFLKSKGIENQFEVVHVTDWGSSEYGSPSANIWVINEDDLQPALNWLAHFNEHPDDPVFKKVKKESNVVSLFSSEPAEEPPAVPAENSMDEEFPADRAAENQNLGFFTFYLFLLCCLIFISTELTPVTQYKTLTILNDYTPPARRYLFYDFPTPFQIVNHVVDTYGEQLKEGASIPPEAIALLSKASSLPYWHGYYDKIVAFFQGAKDPWKIEAPLFEKIKEGEYWRLFTPILLHGNFLHLFFNMIWLLILGKQIEQHIGGLRYLLFILIVAAISNTSQYLMSGFQFLGFSGVLCGMATFIWMRQKVAAWEGYQMQSTTFTFLMFFIIAMLALQLIIFAFTVFHKHPYPFIMANTAHIIGALAGLVLGRLNFFAQKDT